MARRNMATHEGSFIRWQSITLTQLGFVTNLAIATLGFALTLVKDPDVIASCWARCLLVLSILGLLVSVAFGIWCALNRLADFRKTAQNARDRQKLLTMTSEQGKVDRERELAEKYQETKKLGQKTWTLFRWQIGTFGAGILTLVSSGFAAYHTRLF